VQSFLQQPSKGKNRGWSSERPVGKTKARAQSSKKTQRESYKRERNDPPWIDPKIQKDLPNAALRGSVPKFLKQRQRNLSG